MNLDGRNLPDDPQQADADHIADVLRPLRELGPPRSTQEGNAARIAVELSRMKPGRRIRDRSWWQKRVTVPLPVAAMVMFALVILSFLQMWNSGNRGHIGMAATQENRPSAANLPSPVAPEISKPNSGFVACEPVFYQEHTVIAGLGTIRSIQYYKCESEQQ